MTMTFIASSLWLVDLDIGLLNGATKLINYVNAFDGFNPAKTVYGILENITIPPKIEPRVAE
jgi:hypothetical protein